MSPALEFRGIVASDGIFAGPIVALDEARGARLHSGSAEAENAALEAAIAAAMADIAALMADVAGAAADILAFQLAMLKDDALKGPAVAAIASGAAADLAWAAALDHQIADYESATDEYFRARAADLRDIRDRVLRHVIGGAPPEAPSAGVLLGEDISPTRFLETDWGRGGAIALRRGSVTSHVAMLARARGVPMIVGLGAGLPATASEAIVDAVAGRVLFDPSAELRLAYDDEQARLAARLARERGFLTRPARRRDGSAVEVLINVASIEELDGIDPGSCDGIGLMRSEFLFRDGRPLPDEETQYRAYRRLLEWAEGKPVTVRTLDAGGDKPISGLTVANEGNPFLGLRGVRLTLVRGEVFRTQLRALARAAVHGNLKIMLPMVTMPAELARAGELLDACLAELEAEGRPCARPPLGIMVEVPAAAICPELFARAAFFSIGSNDLTQYVTAAARDEPAVAALGDPSHPAVIRLIASVAAHGRASGVPVSLCGDMASEPRHLGALLAAGIASLSVAPARIGRVKAALAEL
jgi:phosphotransferase system enzyme I (PtsI)